MQLPVEVIQHIFSFLSPCEIVRLRQVSKKFRDITHSHSLWRKIYANACLLLPPGPFSWQSTRYLERTLVQSELVSKTWTSQPLRQLSHTLTSWKRESDRAITWAVIFGRWCIFLQEKIIRCHDIDTDTYHSLYDGTAHPGFQFMVATAAGVSGKRVYLLLADRRFQLIKLLEFCVDNDSFSEPEIMDWAHVRLQPLDIWPSMDDVHGSTPFLVVRHGQQQSPVVFDLHKRCLYSLPEPKDPSDLANELQFRPTFPYYWHNVSNQLVLTRTHVIAVEMYGWSFDMHALIRAFVVPDSVALLDRTGVGELRLTHEVTIPTALPSFSLLRNSVVDPVTGSVNIRLLLITPSIHEDHKDMSCLDLALPTPVSTTNVLPISIRSQHLFESRWTSVRYTASDDGYVRGMLLTNSGPPHFRATSKFTIDASGEEFIVAVSDSCPVGWDLDDVAFDGTRGRIHSFRSPDVNQVVTVDLA
ncbi:hypothetical protein OG21DRAFT_1497072 [Imleria badia]|nr:hypothetical protein OG21DRAFT_1497072 [Imleria badia]